ncbi:MAG: aminotransferase class I/II-fold pyridoxal phosphate-dependent enzyme [Patescibacteria group bacterium]
MSIFNRFKPISISLSPNVQKDDVILALKLLFQPWKSKKGSVIKELENNFKNYLGVRHAFSFNAGRSAFYAILKALDLEPGSDVLLQAFTCNAVPNPILWAGFNPIYIDCNTDFNINIEDLKKKIKELYDNSNDRRKYTILVVQHTFGLPANMDEIMKIAQENNITIIEDCAHALGTKYNNQYAGTFGKAAFFSFSRDKVISCVYGGMAVTNDDEMSKKLEQLQEDFGMPSLIWIKQQLLHPIFLNYIILPLYNFLDLGKLFLIILQWTHLLSKAVSRGEKRGLMPDYFPRALPNALAIMAQNQFNKLEKFNAHRKEIAEFYYKELTNTKFILPSKSTRPGLVDNLVDNLGGNIFLRFTVRHPKAHEIIYDAWHNQNTLLGDWYTTPIAPDDTKLNQMHYKVGACSNAEKLASETLNLPTHINISIEDAQRIIDFLKKYY